MTKVVVASFIGTTIEWYDFQLYGLGAAVVFNKLFFPNVSPLTGTLASFSVFAIGFLARPIGGLVFGHFGDRVGRKSILLITLLLMGTTFLVGLLPTYATAGITAPVLLVTLRLLGGIGLGGEWGGAVLVSVEHAPAHRRGLYGSWPQMGSPAGLLLATAVFAVVSTLPAQDFETWGWRIPFLLSAVLIVIGLFVRARLAETPAFLQEQKQRQHSRRTPLMAVLREHPKSVLLSIGAFVVTSGGYYVYATYMVSYGTKQLGLSANTMLIAGIVFSVFALAASPVFSALSDRVGRRPVFLAVAAFTALYAFPMFWLVGSRLPVVVWAALALGGVANGALYGLMGSLTAEMFETHVRYTGASIGQQVSAAAVGGTTPLIVTTLVATAGAAWPAPGWLALLALISLGCVYALTETSHAKLVRTTC